MTRSGFSLKLDRVAGNHSEGAKNHSEGTKIPLMWLKLLIFFLGKTLQVGAEPLLS